jgi:hypothetical protein
MKTPLLIVLAVVVLGTGSALAIMNNACKSSHYAWCAPDSSTAKSASEAEGALPAEVMRRVAPRNINFRARGTFRGRMLRFRAASATTPVALA